MIKNTKWILFDFLPYEYKALETYLEKMASEGWKLQGIKGLFLKFKRIDTKKIRYSVDVMDKISFFDGKNSSSALEYREYCKVAGWDFLCEREKIQIYLSESNEESVPIHTDEKEKFGCILKASFKYALLSLINLVIMLVSQYIITMKGVDAKFLASNLQLFSLFIFLLLSIHEIINLFNFLIWIINGKISINNGKIVRYNFYNSVKIKNIIRKLTLGVALVSILFMVLNSEIFILKLMLVILILSIGLYKIIDIISNTKFEKKRIINIITYTIVFVAGFIIINKLAFNEIFIEKNFKEVRNNNHIITIKDFNDERDEKETLYINENNGILASSLYYSERGYKFDISYDLFQSKFEGIVKYNFNRKMKWLKENDIKYIKRDIDYIPEGINVYMNQNGNNYILLSSNKVIEFNNWDKALTEEELINRVYKKVIKE